MRSPLERAARALYNLDGYAEETALGGAPRWKDYLPKARAVLEAVREPSGSMMRETDYHREAQQIWHKMIDSVLAEEP